MQIFNVIIAIGVVGIVGGIALPPFDNNYNNLTGIYKLVFLQE